VVDLNFPSEKGERKSLVYFKFCPISYVYMSLPLASILLMFEFSSQAFVGLFLNTHNPIVLPGSKIVRSLMASA